MYAHVKVFPACIDGRLVTLMDNCFISPSAKCWPLIFPTNSENHKSLSNYGFTKLRWFNQDAFMDSPTSHFRSHFWSWSCGCGQWTLKSHWYQLSWSCRQACAQKVGEERTAEYNTVPLRNSLSQVGQEETKKNHAFLFIERKSDGQSASG